MTQPQTIVEEMPASRQVRRRVKRMEIKRIISEAKVTAGKVKLAGGAASIRTLHDARWKIAFVLKRLKEAKAAREAKLVAARATIN